MRLLIFILLLGISVNSDSRQTHKIASTKISKEGTICLREGNYKKALPQLKDNFQLGWACENLGDFGTAIYYYEKANPVLREHAIYRIANCFKELNKYEKAIIYYEKLANEFPDFISLIWAMRELGWCYEKLKDWENAIDVWDYEFEPPFSWYKIANVIEKAECKIPKYESSASLWLKIATQYPRSEYAKYAIAKLPEDSLLLIGKINHFAGKHKDAAASLQGIRGGGGFLAKSLYKLGKYRYARGIARGYKLWGLAGQCSEKLEEDEKALSDYNKSFDPEAIYLKARLLEKLEKFDEAIIAYRSIPENTSFFEYANFRAGFLALDLRQLNIAYRCFRKAPKSISYYWCYRVMLEEGDDWKAQLYKKKLIEEYPLSYYTWRLGKRGKISKISTAKWIAKNSDCTLSLNEYERFERGRLLVELGITKYGLAEFRALPNNPLANWKIAKTFHIYGLDWLAIPYAKRIQFKGPVPREFTKVLYPLSFLPTIQKESEAQGIDKFLVFALIREESHFNPNAVSSSNAKGLMQVIPPTGRHIAQKIGVKRYNLFHPQTSIKFGAFYIAYCLEKFNGGIEFALAGYNGGPHNVEKWMVSRDPTKMDEWVEHIPFKETRRYVRKVAGSYHAYKMLYE